MSAVKAQRDVPAPSGRTTLYRIVVRGRLDARWSGRLGGLTIATTDGGVEGVVTTLEGRLRDQEELSGILNGLYELHLPILSVRKLDEED